MKLARQKLLPWWAVILLTAPLLAACGATTPEAAPGQDVAEPELDPASLEPVTLAADEKLRVVATTNIVGDVVGQVGGDRIELTTLMGIGIDPHSYVPTPIDTAAIHDAHVVFANGAGLEANLDEMFAAAGGEAAQIQLSHGLEPRSTGETDEEASAGHDHEADGDPHVWFDVLNVIHWVETIEAALSALDPANGQAYRANAGAYIRQLEDLDAWVVEQLATIPEANRKLVTNHPAFAYLERYGLEQVGAVYPVSPSAEPSAQDIAALEDTIRNYGLPAVFTESTVNPKLAQQVADDTGVTLVALYSGSLGEPGSGAETYILLIRYDVAAIVDALQWP
jgi:ABC-type Zn uptake system ZnuABC Zn-binding protein ZnuA